MDEIMDYIFPYTGKTIEETLRDAFTSCSVSTSTQGASLIFGNSTTSIIVSIPSATQITAGLMPPEVFESIARINADVNALDAKIDSKFVESFPSTSGVQVSSSSSTGISLRFVDEDSKVLYSASIPLATERNVGLLSAEDKAVINSIGRTYYAKSVRNVITSSGMPMTTGTLCFDVVKKALLLESGGQYFAEWGVLGDPNGLSLEAYKDTRVIISADTKLYRWQNAEWVKVANSGSKYDIVELTEAEFQKRKERGELVEGELYLTY